MNIPIEDVQNVLNYHWLDELKNYNDFFNPNICHICKRTNNGNLIVCAQCWLISYCSDKHREKHYLEHLEFCKSITRYLRSMNGIRWRTLNTNTNEWLDSKNLLLLQIIQQSLPTECEMEFLYAIKSCRICYRRVNLQHCQTCYSDYYCIDHATEFQIYHALKCSKMLLCLNLKIIKLRFNKFPITYISFPEKARSIEYMTSFIIRYVRSPFHRGLESWTSLEYLYSDYLSGPLTLYDGMRKANLLDLPDMTGPECVVHLITDDYIEYKYAPAWELLLHSLTRIKKLTVILVGPDKVYGNKDIQVCWKCTRRKQTLILEYPHLGYDAYVTSESYQQPNVIVIMNATLNTLNIWCGNILAKAQLIKCPFLLTARSQQMLEYNVNMIQKRTNVNPIYNEQNNFPSFIPLKEKLTDNFWYRNSYITVYPKLSSSQK